MSRKTAHWYQLWFWIKQVQRKASLYITLVMDSDHNRVLRYEVGRDIEADDRIQEYLRPKEKIRACIHDMSPTYISAYMKEFPEAQITLDHFQGM